MLGQTNFGILIPVNRKDADSRNQKGRTFQTLVRLFLQSQNYEVIEEFRAAGTEIDLLCTSTLGGEKLVAECKARTENVRSDAVNKLHTDVDLYSAAKGYIFSISDIAGEARTRLDELNNRYHGRYAFISPEHLIKSLLNANLIRLPRGRDESSFAELSLCAVGSDVIWIEVAREPQRRLPVGLRAWAARTGESLDLAQCPDLTESDFPHPELNWLSTEEAASEVREIQSVVEVIPGEEWSDYRPSRPDDFVGRQQVISSISSFLERVRDGKSNSRLFGIKGKSGWGKSSLALKLRSQLGNSRILLLPVDCRAAVSSLYPDLAVAKAFKLLSGYINPGPLFDYKETYTTNPFKEDAARELLEHARSNGVLVGIIFDQFEAVIHRKELQSAFDRMREISLACEEAESAFVIGFSWKTDGTVGSDYPGYHLWHSLSDHRRDFEIDRFTREDADQFLQLAQRESGRRIRPQLKKFIIEHYAGFPWLLKKLTRHYIERQGQPGEPVGTALLSLEELFKSDIEELTLTESRSLKFIAQSAPIDYGSVSEKFGDQAIVSLMEKRLVINTGGQLNLYWDIFRDYIIYDEVPYLPNTFVPSISMRKIRSALNYLMGRESSTYHDLAKHLGISLSTADNVVRDLQNFGLVEPIRLDQTLIVTTDDSVQMTNRILEFLRTHAVYTSASKIVSAEGFATLEQILALSAKEYEFISIDEKTLATYVRKILTYCLNFGLLEKEGAIFVHSDPIVDILDEGSRVVRVSEVELFRAPAPPERVLELMHKVAAAGSYPFDMAAEEGLRNSVFAARTLGVIENEGDRLVLSKSTRRASSLDFALRNAVNSVEPFATGFVGFATNGLSAEELGLHINDLFGLTWTPASCRRYGSAYKRWITWAT